MARKFLITVTMLMLMPFAAHACGFGEKTVEGYENTPVTHAYQHWNQGAASPVAFVFIDVRTPEEFAEGHIEGASHIPLQQLADRMAEVPKDKQVYLYCRSGRRSANAAAMLAKAGYSNIENVVGGIIAWQEAGHPVVRND